MEVLLQFLHTFFLFQVVFEVHIFEILTNLKVSGKILVITEEENYNLAVSGANLPNVYVQTRNHLSVYDLINADCYVMDEAAVMKYEEVLK